MNLKRCVKCILPKDYPDTFFNSDGVCNLCAEHQKSNYTSGKEELLKLIKSAKKTGKFDCVVPLSGGKDSTYILYYIVKELGLKPIAVNYNSGFQPEIAKENIKSTCQILNVPLIVKKPNKFLQKNLIRQALLISEGVGSFISRVCGNCEAFLRTIPYNVARQYKVPFIIWGSSPMESLDYKKYRFGRKERNPFKIIAEKIRRFNVTPAKTIKILVPFIIYNILSICQRIEIGVPLKYVFNPDIAPPFNRGGIKYIHFFDYIEWNSIRGQKLLKDALGWRTPQDRDIRFDCVLHCFGNHFYLQKKKISADGIILCKMIRENKITREEALAKEEHVIKTAEDECKEVLNNMNLVRFKMPKISN